MVSLSCQKWEPDGGWVYKVVDQHTCDPVTVREVADCEKTERDEGDHPGGLPGTPEFPTPLPQSDC